MVFFEPKPESWRKPTDVRARGAKRIKVNLCTLFHSLNSDAEQEQEI